MCGFNDFLWVDEYDELDFKQNEYVSTVFKMARDYSRRGNLYLSLHLTLQTIIICCALSLPILVNVPFVDKLLPTILSIVVALGVGLSSWVKLGVHAALSYDAHRTCAEECQEFEFLIGVYTGLDRKDAFKLFVERTQELRNHVVHATVSSSAYSNFQFSTSASQNAQITTPGSN